MNIFIQPAKYCLLAIAMVAVAMLTACDDDDFKHNPSVAITIESFVPTTGGSGTDILITGSNFSADTSEITITLNGKEMPIVGANETHIMVVVPKGAGSGAINVTIGSQSAQSTGSFTYNFIRRVSTLAGSATGESGYLDAKGTDALFSFSSQSWYRMMGIAVDDDLNVYVADPGNSCIRKIDPNGNVTTLAGKAGESGHTDGTGTDARFNIPYGLTVDNEGNVYTADPGNWDIRKITPEGVATTLAWGSAEPWCIAFNKADGNLYYSPASSSGSVYSVSLSGDNRGQIVGGISYPVGIGFDSNGNMYVTAHGENVIKRYEYNTWQESTIAGQSWTSGYKNGSGTEALFANPWGLAVDNNGNIYVAGNGTWDGGSYNADQSIRYIEAGTWEVSTMAGSGTAGYNDDIGTAAMFSAPTGVAVDKNGTVYVLDKNNNCIRKIVSE